MVEMIYDVWLTKIDGIGCHLQRELLATFGSAERIYQADLEKLLQVPGIGKTKCASILKHRDLSRAEKILQDCKKNGISIMNLDNPLYPEKAKGIKDMPTILYYMGNPKIIRSSVAVVGSRRCSQLGKKKTVDLVKSLVEKDITVVSGMAKGIDSYAHTSCILAGGYTIAVLGNGLDICYPSEHDKLRDKIVEQGMLLSEYEPGVPASRYHFPQRNRIIAAFSDTIYAPEITEKSGAQYTLSYGRKYGRYVILYS